MSKREKLRRRLRNNPKDRTRQEIETLLGHFGFVLDRISGSHHVFILSKGETTGRITVPVHCQKVKTVYVKQVIEVLDELFPPESEESEDNDDE